jgi:hypothetical protein
MRTRLWDRIDMSAGPDGCWPWRGRVGYRDGYGRFGDWLVHRRVWFEVNGPIPEGMLICHHCDNRPCCNPKHLFLGTQADNLADMVAKGRSASGDRSGARRHPERLWRGSQIPQSKVTEADVPDIRARAAAGESQRSIGLSHGLTQGAVWSIVQRRTWRHVA